ncbi:5-deoxy-glucuronate isomerase [Streptomyces sp. ICN441]|uniref:5-deoxy-glucuronate isomerase n=1 Tax=Streptomyces sp. ICN441 TaxID=2558286 RepID=UPI0010692764|nr:5-deoxy-glucuronate isomerase [Streptomyces sp. ICN441]TFE47691.1 5-deoxy-glucuronate isomerase [Streptomyces sp. ICN441]
MDHKHHRAPENHEAHEDHRDHRDHEDHEDHEARDDHRHHGDRADHHDHHDHRAHGDRENRTAHDRHLPAGTAADGPYALAVDPGRAGWEYSALRILELAPGASHRLDTGDSEWIVLPLAGGCTVRTEDTTMELAGRAGVFAGVTDFAYVPRDARVLIASAAGGRFALAGARCERRLPARRGPAPDVPVEDRGSGGCARRVRNFAAADTFTCDRLIAVEVLTPGGNWSSYPPHKHDEHRPGEETELEEIYYFEIEGDHGFGYQRVSPSRPGGTDLLAEVRSGDAVLVPDGWHGPSIAAPGHDMYYLNVMAGPGPERAWRICFHPDHTEGYR